MTPEAQALVREAAEWRLISLLFECPSGEWSTRVGDLAAECTDPELQAAAASAAVEASEGLYHHTFGPGGPAAPREVSHHRDTFLPGAILGEVGAYYDAFAYRPVTAEAPDHVSVEAGFVAYVHLKQAFAVERGDREQAEVAAEAARTFATEHLAVLAAPLAASLEFSGIAYLAKAAAALFARTGEPRRAEIPAPPGLLGDLDGADLAGDGACGCAFPADE